MWELINANRRRSVLLVAGMFALMLSLGFFIGMAAFPGASGYETLYNGQPTGSYHLDPTGGFLGMAIAALIGIVHVLIAYFQGDAILMRASGARRIQREDHPRLFNVVEEMVIASQLPGMPEVYIIDDRAMNAFAAGRKAETAKVAVTAGLLEHLNRDQLQGVIAHEIAHIRHRDVLFMTLVGVLLGAIVMLSELFLRGVFRTGGTHFGGSRRNKDAGGQAIFLVIALVLALLAPFIAQLIYFAVSRRREYLADAGAAVYTRNPEGLASALEVLSGQHESLARVSKATAPMFIVNPLRPEGMAAISLFSTHPPTEKRIAVLRGMAGGAGYSTYQQAWRQVAGGEAKMPRSLLAEGVMPLRASGSEAAPAGPVGQGARTAMARVATQAAAPAREIPVATARAAAVAPGAAKSPPPLPDEARQRMRETGDLLRRMNGFTFLPCACGMTIKLPPEWKRPQVQCPRCGRRHDLPQK